LKPAGAQVAPDALTITAQLAPWLFMRASLEEPLQNLEIETEVSHVPIYLSVN
jgi:hypothetical protein